MPDECPAHGGRDRLAELPALRGDPTQIEHAAARRRQVMASPALTDAQRDELLPFDQASFWLQHQHETHATLGALVDLRIAARLVNAGAAVVATALQDSVFSEWIDDWSYLGWRVGGAAGVLLPVAALDMLRAGTNGEQQVMDLDPNACWSLRDTLLAAEDAAILPPPPGLPPETERALRQWLTTQFDTSPSAYAALVRAHVEALTSEDLAVLSNVLDIALTCRPHPPGEVTSAALDHLRAGGEPQALWTLEMLPRGGRLPFGLAVGLPESNDLELKQITVQGRPRHSLRLQAWGLPVESRAAWRLASMVTTRPGFELPLAHAPEALRKLLSP